MNKIIILMTMGCFFLLGCQSTSPVDVTQVGKNQVDSFSKETAPKYQEFIHPGDTLPIRSIVNVDGNVIDLTNRNKRKLVILFATWCSDSNRALKALNQSALLSDPTLEIIAIAREETSEDVIKWRNEHNIKVPLATDIDRSIYKQFAVGGIPRLITIGKDNKVIRMNLAEGEQQLKLIQW
ncbi:MAG: TlpA disulfide reductase family protein [Alteromonadaceae bacterium]|jgi:peroxiredoxin